MAASDTHGAINAVFRIEQAKRIAGLARMTRDVGLAEELAQDALVTALEKWPEAGVPDNPGARLMATAKQRAPHADTALEKWPEAGVPDNPGAWLMATAKNRALDAIRRTKMVERKHEELAAPVT